MKTWHWIVIGAIGLIILWALYRHGVIFTSYSQQEYTDKDVQTYDNVRRL